ncbi:MAG: BrnT family toxin [Desulfobacterales bacterium]|nr:BrnT family toxin [Desulfobacterales bacterium]
MQFEWDESKNAINIRNHKIDFADVPTVFKGAVLIDYDDRYDYGEDRWIGLGLLHSTVAVVAFTEPRKDTIRIISARKANRKEQEEYYEKTF